MMHYFDGEEFLEDVPSPATVWQLTTIESLWGKVGHEIPKHKRYTIESWVNGCTMISAAEADQLIAELRTYDAPEPVSITDINKHLKKICNDEGGGFKTDTGLNEG